MSFLKTSTIPFKMTDGDSAIVGFPLGAPVVEDVTLLAIWAATKGATSILTFEAETPYGEAGEDPLWTTRGGDTNWSTYKAPKITLASSTTVAGCSGKLTTTATTVADGSYYVTPASGTVSFFGNNADRTLMTIVRCNGLTSAHAECVMRSGLDANYFTALHGLNSVAGQGVVAAYKGAGLWLQVAQTGFSSGDIIIYMNTMDRSTDTVTAHVKGTGRPEVSGTDTADPTYNNISINAPYYGTDSQGSYGPTTDDIVWAGCWPSVLTSADLAEAAAICGAT